MIKFLFICFISSVKLPLYGKTEAGLTTVEVVAGGNETSVDMHHPWDRYLLGFRSAHQFTNYCGFSNGNWVVRDLGVYPYKEAEQASVFCKFQYTFHLKVLSNFGFYLGSSTGYASSLQSTAEDVKIPDSWQFPSVLIGLAYNANASWRLFSGLEYYLERYDGIRLRRQADDGEIASTAQVTDFLIGFDHFFTLHWAVGLIYKSGYAEINPPSDLGDTPLAIAASLKKKDRSLALSFTMHLL